MKTSELFEGKNSSLHKAYTKAVEQKPKELINGFTKEQWKQGEDFVERIKNEDKPKELVDYASKLSLYGKISEQHAKDINEILNDLIPDISKKFNQASWNYPEETETLVISKPKELDWEKEFENWWLDSDRFGENSENWTLLHDDTLEFIKQLLTQQRTELLEEILGLIDNLYIPVGRNELIEEIKKL